MIDYILMVVCALVGYAGGVITDYILQFRKIEKLEDEIRSLTRSNDSLKDDYTFYRDLWKRSFVHSSKLEYENLKLKAQIKELEPHIKELDDTKYIWFKDDCYVITDVQLDHNNDSADTLTVCSEFVKTRRKGNSQ